MRKILILIALLGASSVQAADMPARPYTKAPAFVPAYSWSGLYVGLNAGYGWKDPSVSYTANDATVALSMGPAAGPIIPPANWDIAGALGGGQIGYNWQLSPKWVAGLEADIAASDIKGSAASATIAGGAPSTAAITQKVDWFGTLRGRLGWLPSDRLLLFGTGGLAYGNVKENVVFTSTGAGAVGPTFAYFCTAGAACMVGGQSAVRAGWTAGAGLEYALSQKLTLKAEYLYIDLGTDGAVRVTALNAGGNQPSSFNANFSGVAFNVVRGGLNYKF